MRTGRALLGFALIAASSLVSSALGGSDAPVAVAAPPGERVLLVSDSVGLGTRGYFGDAFPAGWDANVIGTPALFVEQLQSKHVVPTLQGAPHLVGDHVVVAGGYNYPYWDPARFDRSVDSMIATLTNAGVKHVYWVTLREVKPQYISASAWRQVQPYYWYFPEVNDHLEAALLRHDNLTLVDWAAVADQPGLTYDAIHLNATGARLYSQLIADAVATNTTRPIDGSVTEIDVTDEPGASAVALNIAATKTRLGGYFTAFDCAGSPPNVANLNYLRDDTVSGAAIVPVDADGHVCIYNDTASQVIVDVFGVFGSESGLVPGAPNRLFDSRGGGTKERPGAPRRLVVGDAGAAAVALNVTGIQPDGIGYITVHDCAVDPTTATVNLTPGRTSPNLVVVRPDADGAVCVTTTGTATHLTVDRFATFTNDAAIDLVEPTRVFDSRGGAEPVDGGIERFAVSSTPLDAGDDISDGSGTSGPATDPADEPTAEPPADIEAVFVNLAIINARGNGYATVWPCDEPRPETANANFAAGSTVSNFVTVAPDGDGDVCVFTTVAADVAIDVLGAARTGFDGFVPRRVLDTRR